MCCAHFWELGTARYPIKSPGIGKPQKTRRFVDESRQTAITTGSSEDDDLVVRSAISSRQRVARSSSGVSRDCSSVVQDLLLYVCGDSPSQVDM
jgi:hypothetical protein